MASVITVLVVLFLVLALGGPAAVAQPARSEGATASVTIGGKVNINTASVEELMTLSGIGRTVAEKIVEYRTAHGPFKTPEQVRRVRGVGKRLWERNRDRIIAE